MSSFIILTLCNLFIWFLSSVTTFISQILFIKYFKSEFSSKDFIKMSLFSLIPIVNIIVLGCGILDICAITLNKSQVIKSIDTFITNLFKEQT